MNKYESVFLIKGRIKQEKAEKEFEKITKEYSKIVEIVEANFVGKRKLAYPVNKNTNGYFCVIDFEAENHDISVKAENILKEHTENVLKFITVKMEN